MADDVTEVHVRAATMSRLRLAATPRAISGIAAAGARQRAAGRRHADADSRLQQVPAAAHEKDGSSLAASPRRAPKIVSSTPARVETLPSIC